MESYFNLQIITPENLFYEGEVSSVVAPGINGYFGILAHHAPLIAKSNGGKLKIREASGERYFQIGSGIIEVLKNRVAVLTKQAV